LKSIGVTLVNQTWPARAFRFVSVISIFPDLIAYLGALFFCGSLFLGSIGLLSPFLYDLISLLDTNNHGIIRKEFYIDTQELVFGNQNLIRLALFLPALLIVYVRESISVPLRYSSDIFILLVLTIPIFFIFNVPKLSDQNDTNEMLTALKIASWGIIGTSIACLPYIIVNISFSKKLGSIKKRKLTTNKIRLVLTFIRAFFNSYLKIDFSKTIILILILILLLAPAIILQIDRIHFGEILELQFSLFFDGVFNDVNADRLLLNKIAVANLKMLLASLFFLIIGTFIWQHTRIIKWIFAAFGLGVFFWLATITEANSYGVGIGSNRWVFWLLLGVWGVIFFLSLLELTKIFRYHFKSAVIQTIKVSSKGQNESLFLRAFVLDEARIQMRYPILENLLNQYLEIRLEEVISQEAFRSTPLIAVGNPNEKRPQLGAMREYLSGDEWQPFVKDKITSAKNILFVLGEGQFTGWETEKIIEFNCIDKTIFIVPPNRAHAANYLRQNQIISELFGGQRFIDTVLSDRILCFFLSPKQQPMAIIGRSTTELDYTLAVRYALVQKQQESEPSRYL